MSEEDRSAAAGDTEAAETPSAPEARAAASLPPAPPGARQAGSRGADGQPPVIPPAPGLNLYAGVMAGTPIRAAASVPAVPTTPPPPAPAPLDASVTAVPLSVPPPSAVPSPDVPPAPTPYRDPRMSAPAPSAAPPAAMGTGASAARDIIREGPQHGTAVVQSAADVAGWAWCPAHLIASEREGSCPVCAQPFQPAPPWGIPQGPFTPRVTVFQRSRRERIAYTTAAVVAALIAISAIIGLSVLYRHGTPIDSMGQPQSTDAGGASASGAVGASTDNGATTPLTLTALDGRQLVLSGRWLRTTRLYTVMGTIAKQLNGGQAVAPDVSAGKGNSRVAVYNVPSSDPSRTVSDNTQQTSDSSSDTSGTISVAATRQLNVEGHTAFVTDIQRTDTSGRPLLMLRYYLIPTAGHVVMLAVGTDGTNDDLQAVSQAVEALK